MISPIHVAHKCNDSIRPDIFTSPLLKSFRGGLGHILWEGDFVYQAEFSLAQHEDHCPCVGTQFRLLPGSNIIGASLSPGKLQPVITGCSGASLSPEGYSQSLLAAAACKTVYPPVQEQVICALLSL